MGLSNVDKVVFENCVLQEIEKVIEIRHLSLVLRLKAYNYDLEDPRWKVKFFRLERDKKKIIEDFKNAPFYEDFMSVLKEKAEIHIEYLSLMKNNSALYDSNSGFSQRSSEKVEKDINEVIKNETVDIKQLVKYMLNFGHDDNRVRFFHKNKIYRDYQNQIYDYGRIWNEDLTIENFKELSQFYEISGKHDFTANVLDKFNEWSNNHLNFDNDYGVEMQKIIPSIVFKFLKIEKALTANKICLSKKVGRLIEDTPISKLSKAFEEGHPIKHWFYTILSSKIFSTEKTKFLFSCLNVEEMKGIVKKQFENVEVNIHSENDFYYAEFYDQIKSYKPRVNYESEEEGMYSSIKDIFFDKLKAEALYESIHYDKILGSCPYNVRERIVRDWEEKNNLELALSHERDLLDGKNLFEINNTKSFIFNFEIFEQLVNKSSNYTGYSYDLSFNIGMCSLSVGSLDNKSIGFFNIQNENFTHENFKNLLMYAAEQLSMVLDEKKKAGWNENGINVEEEFVEIISTGIREQELLNRMEEINRNKSRNLVVGKKKV